jgi:hypothetical protein
LHGLVRHLAVFSREAPFIGSPRPGLTPDDFTRGREVVEGVQGFQPQQWRRAKSKERPSSGDRSFEACPTRYRLFRPSVVLLCVQDNHG